MLASKQHQSFELLEMSNDTCLICADFFHPIERVPTIVSCGHTGVCSICFLRLRSVLRDFNCPQCKQNCESVICSIDKNAKYSDFETWGDQLPGFICDHTSRMYFPQEHHKQKIEKLRKSLCPVCGVVKRDSKTLRLHMAEHKLQMCALCIEFKHSFPSEQSIYTQVEYEAHIRVGDKDGSEGHPNCEFCKRRYYDKNALFQHLQKDHYSCHICDQNGIQFKYYNDYPSLEDHFRSAHIICEEPNCLQKRFVVFSNEFDFSNHMVNYHPQNAVNTFIFYFYKFNSTLK